MQTVLVEHFGRRTTSGFKVSVEYIRIKIHADWPSDCAGYFIDGRQAKDTDIVQCLENWSFEDTVKVKFSHQTIGEREQEPIVAEVLHFDNPGQ